MTTLSSHHEENGTRPAPGVRVGRQGLALLLIALVPVATIGPNIGDRGLRTEHVYAIVAVGLLWLLYGPPRRLSPAYWMVLVAWAMVSLVALIGGVMPVESLVTSLERTVPEGVSRLGVPILGMIIGAYAGCAAPTSRERGLRRRRPLELMMAVLVIVGCLNALVAAASVVVDIPWLVLFDRPDRATASVAEVAAQGGRYGGVINQPFESGLLYSVALLTAIRLWRTNIFRMGGFIVLASLIGVGGAMSGSKLFLFGGAPIALAYLVLGTQPLRASRLVGSGLAVLASTLAGWYALATFNQPGLDRISANYLPWNMQDPRWTIFAGRLEDHRTVDRMRTVIHEAGPFGLGARGGRWPYDFGVMEFAAVAGWVGLAAMALISVVLLSASASRRWERYWLALAVLAVGANLGGPSLTANRNALVMWVLFGAMLFCHRASQGRLDPAPHRAAS